MNQYQFDLGPSTIGKFGAILRILFATKISQVLAVSIGVAVITFGILDIFMQRSLFILKKNSLDEDTGSKFRASLLLLVASLIPIVITLAHLFTTKQSLASKFSGLLTGTFIAFAVTWLFSWNLKRCFRRPTKPEEDASNAEKTEYEEKMAEYNHVRKKQFLLSTACRIIIDTISANMVMWLARLLASLVNLFIGIIHISFVTNYYIMAILVNLILSFILLGILGETRDMASANVIGSMIGGLAHGFIRRKLRTELNEEYKKKYDTKKPSEKRSTT
jgi:hypothetical protein